jgi:hypothetical protein
VTCHIRPKVVFFHLMHHVGPWKLLDFGTFQFWIFRLGTLKGYTVCCNKSHVNVIFLKIPFYPFSCDGEMK